MTGKGPASNRKTVAITLAVLLAVVAISYVIQYNSSSARMDRCVKAESSAYDSDP